MGAGKPGINNYLRVARSQNIGIGPSLTPGETDAPFFPARYQLWYSGQEKPPPETGEGDGKKDSHYAG